MLLTKKRIWTSAIGTLFVVVNLGFLFLQIHKQSQFVKLSYGKQRLEKELGQLEKQRNDLVHRLYLQQSHKTVQKYATNKLGFQSTSVKQIHSLGKPGNQGI